MANNLVSYERFFALPANIQARAGATVEELQMAAGKPDPNPVVQPMPELDKARLFLARVRPLKSLVEDLKGMAEHVEVRAIASAKA